MLISLMKQTNGFMEWLGDAPDYRLTEENYLCARWAEVRDMDFLERNRPFKFMTIPEFRTFIDSPITTLDKTKGVPISDNYPRFTEKLENLYAVAIADPDCTHVMVTNRIHR